MFIEKFLFTSVLEDHYKVLWLHDQFVISTLIYYRFIPPVQALSVNLSDIFPFLTGIEGPTNACFRKMTMHLSSFIIIIGRRILGRRCHRAFGKDQSVSALQRLAWLKRPIRERQSLLQVGHVLAVEVELNFRRVLFSAFLSPRSLSACTMPLLAAHLQRERSLAT